MEWRIYLKCIIFLKPKWKLSAPLSPMKRRHHRGERLASWQRSAAVIFLCVPIQVNEMRVQRNRAGIQVWQRHEGHETEEFNEWSWAAVQSHSLLPFSMTANAISCLYPTTHLTRVRMYSKCLIRTCSMLPQDDKCDPLNTCAVWIWMDVSVLIRFWIISTDLNESLYAIHPLWDLLLVVSHIYLLHSLACSGNEALPSSRFRGCGALAVVLGSSQLSSLFSLALPQVVLTHSTFTWLQQRFTCLWSLYCGSGADLGRKCAERSLAAF